MTIQEVEQLIKITREQIMKDHEIMVYAKARKKINIDYLVELNKELKDKRKDRSNA